MNQMVSLFQLQCELFAIAMKGKQVLKPLSLLFLD